MRKLKAIVIGGGINSAVGRVHQEALKMAEIDVIDGLFSRSKEINIESKKTWGIKSNNENEDLETLCKKYTSLEKESIVAIVLTPTTNHYNDIMYLLRNDMNVICEKPLTMTYDQATKIKETAKEMKKIVRCTYNYGGYPMFRELAKQVEKGKLGKIQQIILQMPQEGLVKPPNIAGEKKPPQQWRLRDPVETSMANLDLGAHLYQLGKMITKEQIKVSASSMVNYTSYDGIEDTTYALINTDSGVKGIFWITKSMLGMRNGLQIIVSGENGTFKWKQIDPDKLEYSNKEILSQVIDRGSKCVEASKKRYDRMKAGHPTGYIEAFANTYIDIKKEINDWIAKGVDSSSYGLDINNSIEISGFLEELKKKRVEK